MDDIDITWLPLDLREAVKGTTAEAKVREWYWRDKDFYKALQEKIVAQRAELAALRRVAEAARG